MVLVGTWAQGLPARPGDRGGALRVLPGR